MELFSIRIQRTFQLVSTNIALFLETARAGAVLIYRYEVFHFERPPAVGLNVVVSDRLTAIRSARPFDCRRHLVQRARRLAQCTVRFLVGEPHHAGPHPLRQTVELPRLRKAHGEGFARRAEQVPRATHNRLQIVSFHSIVVILLGGGG